MGETFPPITGWGEGQTLEEHNAHQRELAERYEWARSRMAPCVCGKFVEGALCICDERERRRPPGQVQAELAGIYRNRHLKGLSAKREFPPLARCPMGTCFWCRQAIVHGRAKQRSMHDGRKDEPDCRWLYHLHTRREVQQDYLLDRDGPGCCDCGALVGRFGAIWTDPTEERVAETWEQRAWMRKRFAECPAGPVTYISWRSHLEVDHFVPLALAWVAFPDPNRRRWFFGPAALQLLCHECHKKKTREDVALLREAQKRGEKWAKQQVLSRLKARGTLKITPA